MVLGLLLLAAQAGPATLPEMLSRAMQSPEASDRVSARRELTEALRLYPASPAVHNFLGVVEAGDGNYLAAEKRFREAVLRAPDYTDAYLNLGRLYQENGGKDPKAATKALAAYQAILRYDPAHADARFQSAALLQAMGEFGRSFDELGLLYQRLGQPEKAAEALERCLKLDPDHYLGNLHLMMLYAQTRDPREPEQRRRFDEIKKRGAEKRADFLRPVEVRPY
jgi:Tfp pilus assembly protein PilF